MLDLASLLVLARHTAWVLYVDILVLEVRQHVLRIYIMMLKIWSRWAATSWTPSASP